MQSGLSNSTQLLSESLEVGPGANLGFFLGGDVPLTNGVTDCRVRLTNSKSDRIQIRLHFIGVGVGTPCTLPLDPAL